MHCWGYDEPIFGPNSIQSPEYEYIYPLGEVNMGPICKVLPYWLAV